MKKTFLVLSMLGAGTVLMAQESTQTGMDDGRVAAQDLIGAVTTPALPIKQTYVPDEVMDRVTGTYGDKLYAIKQVKSGSGENVYQVTLIDNSQSTVAWVGETGSEVAYVYRTDDSEMMAGTNTNNSNSEAAAATDPNAATAPSVDDNYTSPQSNTLDNSVNTLNEPMNDSGNDTLTPDEDTDGQNAPSAAEIPNTEGTLPSNNTLNSNTNTARPEGDQ